MNTNIEIITWNKALKSGIKTIDEQHKELFEIINKMFCHVNGNEEQERKYFKKVIKKAIHYINIHFETEERIMQHTKFKGYEEHKKLHDNFMLAVAKSVRDYKSMELFSLFDFTMFFRDWLLSHIAIMDKKYFNHFKKAATRKPDGKLSINAEDLKKSA